jgi:hypothetical protein
MALFRTSLFSQRLLAKRIPSAPTPSQHKQILREQVATYAAQLAQHDTALNRAVYALFKLTPEEIALIESGADA